MTALYVLGGLLVAAGTIYAVTLILLHRALDAEDYRAQTSQRIKAAGWRTHGNVTYLDGGYVYASTKPVQPREEVGLDARQRLAGEVLGVVADRESLTGGKGFSSGPPAKPTREGGTTA